MRLRLTLVLLLGLPFGSLVWLVMHRQFGAANGFLTVVDVIYVCLLYTWLRLGRPTR